MWELLYNLQESKSLSYLMDQPNLNMWLDVVKDYNCQISSLSGKANVVASALSCKMVNTPMRDEHHFTIVVLIREAQIEVIKNEK